MKKWYSISKPKPVFDGLFNRYDEQREARLRADFLSNPIVRPPSFQLVGAERIAELKEETFHRIQHIRKNCPCPLREKQRREMLVKKFTRCWQRLELLSAFNKWKDLDGRVFGDLLTSHNKKIKEVYKLPVEA